VTQPTPHAESSERAKEKKKEKRVDSSRGYKGDGGEEAHARGSGNMYKRDKGNTTGK